jgi:hypothetical protein
MTLSFWSRADSDSAVYRVYAEWKDVDGTFRRPDAGIVGSTVWLWGGTRWTRHVLRWRMPARSDGRPYVVIEAARGTVVVEDVALTAATIWRRALAVTAVVAAAAAAALAIAALLPGVGGVVLLRAGVAAVLLGWAGSCAVSGVIDSGWRALGHRRPDITDDPQRPPDRLVFLALAQQSEWLRPSLRTDLPLTVQAPSDWPFAGTLDYLLYDAVAHRPTEKPTATNLLVLDVMPGGVRRDPPSPAAPPHEAVLVKRFEFGALHRTVERKSGTAVVP